MALIAETGEDAPTDRTYQENLFALAANAGGQPTVRGGGRLSKAQGAQRLRQVKSGAKRDGKLRS